MGAENEHSNSNPFVRALRGDLEQDPKDLSKAEPNEVVAGTLEALTLGDQLAESSDPASEERTRPEPGGTNGDDRMEAVVDLLFGHHLSEINTGMRALEKQIAERVDKAESEMMARMESINRSTKGELELLNKRIEEERTTRDSALGEIGGHLEGAIREIDKRMEQIETDAEQHHEKAQRELDEKMAQAAEQTSTLRTAVEEEIAEMKASLSSRAELGNLFAELGKRLGSGTG